MARIAKGSIWAALGGLAGYAIADSAGALVGMILGALAYIAIALVQPLAYEFWRAGRRSKNPGFLRIRAEATRVIPSPPMSKRISECITVNELHEKLLSVCRTYRFVKGEPEIKIREAVQKLADELARNEEFFTPDMENYKLNLYWTLRNAGHRTEATRVVFALGPEEVLDVLRAMMKRFLSGEIQNIPLNMTVVSYGALFRMAIDKAKQ